MDTSPVSALLLHGAAEAPSSASPSCKPRSPRRGFLGWDSSAWGSPGGVGRQKAPVSPPSSSPRQADGSIGARRPRGLSDGFTRTAPVQGLPLTLFSLNKLLYSKDFSALICISISGSPPDSAAAAGCLPAPPASAANPAVNRHRNLSLQLLADLQLNIFTIKFFLRKCFEPCFPFLRSPGVGTWVLGAVLQHPASQPAKVTGSSGSHIPISGVTLEALLLTTFAALHG